MILPTCESKRQLVVSGSSILVMLTFENWLGMRSRHAVRHGLFRLIVILSLFVGFHMQRLVGLHAAVCACARMCWNQKASFACVFCQGLETITSCELCLRNPYLSAPSLFPHKPTAYTRVRMHGGTTSYWMHISSLRLGTCRKWTSTCHTLSKIAGQSLL